MDGARRLTRAGAVASARIGGDLHPHGAIVTRSGSRGSIRGHAEREAAALNILPRSRRVEMSSDVPPAAVLDRLRRLAANWRGSTLAGPALQAGIHGWSIDERGEGFVVRPRSSLSGAPVAIFEGSVQPSFSGSSICGHIRLHPFTRLFLIVVIVVAAAVPIGALFESVPGQDWHQHIVRAGKILAISALIVAAGLVMVSGGMRMVGRHIVALLTAAAQPAGEPGPGTGPA